MALRTIAVLLILPVFACVVYAVEKSGAPEAQVVFRKAINESLELAVIREPGVAPDVVRPLMDARAVVGAVYCVRIELRSPGQPPLTLCSHPIAAGGKDYDKTFDVLDLLVEQDQEAIARGVTAKRAMITLAVAQGSDIALWRVTPFPSKSWASTWTPLRGADWSMHSSPARVDRSGVSVGLGRSEGGRLRVEVVDRRDIGGGYHTIFEQVPGNWEFKQVKQWMSKERQPSTRPGAMQTGDEKQDEMQ